MRSLRLRKICVESAIQTLMIQYVIRYHHFPTRKEEPLTAVYHPYAL